MKLLKQTILEKGEVAGADILKVDRFLNHQLDVHLLNEIGKEFHKRFSGKQIDKIVTIEASGIAIAAIAAQHFSVPVVFAKKVASKNLDDKTYETKVYSFTKDKEYTVRISKKFLSAADNVLILDDFLARGRAALGLIDLVEQAGATVQGVGIVIEKGFQEGATLLTDRGIHLESLAVINAFENGRPVFEETNPYTDAESA